MKFWGKFYKELVCVVEMGEEIKTRFYYIGEGREVNPLTSVLAFASEDASGVLSIRDKFGNVYSVDDVRYRLSPVSIAKVKRIQESNNRENDFIEEGISRLAYLVRGDYI